MMNEPSDQNAALSSNDTQISYKRDNGFNAMLSLSKVQKNISYKPDLEPVNVKLPVCNGSKIQVIDKSSLAVAHNNNSFKVSCIIVDSDSIPILGMKTKEYLQLYKKTVEFKQIVKRFSQNFMIE